MMCLKESLVLLSTIFSNVLHNPFSAIVYPEERAALPAKQDFSVTDMNHTFLGFPKSNAMRALQVNSSIRTIRTSLIAQGLNCFSK